MKIVMLLTLMLLILGCSTTMDQSKITDIQCDALTPCPDSLECYKFPEIEGPVCAQPDPHSYYKCPLGKELLVMESYPPQLRCS